MAYPAYYILERRFGACGKIVDILLDPEHNDAAEWLPTSDLQQQEDMTECLYSECPTAALAAFCEALKKPSLSLWNDALATLAEIDWTIPLLRTSLRAGQRLASDLFDAEFGHYLSAHKNPALPHSPNDFSFRRLLQSSDIAVRTMWPRCRASVVHDEQRQYGEYFADIVHLTAGIGKVERDTGVRLPELIGGLHAVTEFCMGNSREEPTLTADAAVERSSAPGAPSAPTAIPGGRRSIDLGVVATFILGVVELELFLDLLDHDVAAGEHHLEEVGPVSRCEKHASQGLGT